MKVLFCNRHSMLSLAMSIVCASLLTSCEKEKPQMGQASSKTMQVSLSDKTLKNSYTAAIKGTQHVEIRPQVSGIITEIRINEGASVRKGQTLFIIDQVPYKAALETALANLRSAEAKMATAQLVAQSKEQLYKENVVSEFDHLTALNTLKEAQAAIAQCKAQELNARNNLSYTEVKSPVDGVASMIPYRVGALVSSGISEPLVTVSDHTDVYAYFSMTENQILDLMRKNGTTSGVIESLPAVELQLSNGTLYEHKGKIDAISGTIDATTGAVSVRATFPNPEKILRNGASGKVLIATSRTGCIAIPQVATFELQNKVFVYKVVDGKAQSSAINTLSINDGKEYIVESGLAEGDIIIAEGAGLVREGEPVIIGQANEQQNQEKQ